MKIISGTLKGRQVEGFKNRGTRPTMDRVKESLFGVIQEKIPGSVVLDLFSGSGNLAIEAISEGASFAYLNDKSKSAVKLIQKNIHNFLIEEKTNVTSLDFKKALEEASRKKITFDIIFLDPPYDTTYIKESLVLIEKYHLLKKGGQVICETDDLRKIPDTSLKYVKNKKYGDKYIVILESL